MGGDRRGDQELHACGRVLDVSGMLFDLYAFIFERQSRHVCSTAPVAFSQMLLKAVTTWGHGASFSKLARADA